MESDIEISKNFNVRLVESYSYAAGLWNNIQGEGGWKSQAFLNQSTVYREF